MKWYVYILQSELDSRYYVGYTKHLGERLTRHNEAEAGWSKGRGPWKLVYFEEYETRSEAMTREKEVKAKKSRRYIGALVSEAGLGQVRRRCGAVV